MVTLGVEGGGSWPTEHGQLWLRIRGRTREDSNSKGCVLLEQCLRGDGGWTKELNVGLQNYKDGIIIFEVWAGESRSTDFLQFVTGWTMDLGRWIEFGAAKRWYEIKDARVKGQGAAGEVVGGQEYCEIVMELHQLGAYLGVSLADVESPITKSPDLPSSDTDLPVNEAPSARKSAFRFTIPYRSLAKTGKLRAIRVGQIVHELRTDVLRDILPVTLFGCINTERDRNSSSNDGVIKALILLQFSCQYASYCVGELERYSSTLDRRKYKLVTKVAQLKHRQRLLKEQKTNLMREDEVLSCSLDGMQSLLHVLERR